MNLSELTKHPFVENIYVTKTGRVFEVREIKSHSRSTKNKIPYRGISYKRIKYSVHRLVAETFLKNPENKPCVCHKDDNPENNHVENLWWGTYEENTRDMLSKGRLKKRRSKRATRRIMTVMKLHEQGLNNRKIARIVKVHESRVSQILKGLKNLINDDNH